MSFTLPAAQFGETWTHELDTYDAAIEPGIAEWGAREEVPVRARSVWVLRRVEENRVAD